MTKRLALLCISALLLVTPTLFAQSTHDTLDLVGTPDLIVRGDMLGQQWVERDEDLPATYCSVNEGHVTPGIRRIVRFTVMTPNIGDADLFLGDPGAHIAANDGLYEYAECHHHYHFKHYATYQLIDPRTGYVWKAAKRGFCMLDTDPNPAWMGTPPKDGQFHNCGSLASSGYQGISAGWTDTYRFTLGGQYFVLDGGDGQPPVPAGDYILRITVNPPYAPDRKGNCPRVKDPATGLCHQFAESNYANNMAETVLNLPDHPGRQGNGPLKNSTALNYEPIDHE